MQVTLRSLGGRRRLIAGSLRVAAPVEPVWCSLTSFAEMHTFVPHILESRYDTEQQLLEQVAVVSRRLRLRSRMVMHVHMDRAHGVILFTRHESRDFSEWRGMYRVTPEDNRWTLLEYELDVVPMLLFPVALVERKILKEVPRVLRAFCDRALELHGQRQQLGRRPDLYEI